MTDRVGRKRQQLHELFDNLPHQVRYNYTEHMLNDARHLQNVHALATSQPPIGSMTAAQAKARGAKIPTFSIQRHADNARAGFEHNTYFSVPSWTDADRWTLEKQRHKERQAKRNQVSSPHSTRRMPWET